MSAAASVRRLDWIVLPVLGLATILLLAFVTEALARAFFKQSKSTTLSCLVLNDPSTGVRAIPDTECSQKMFESNLIHYVFNSCGHRAGRDCGPKAPNSYRIVLVGSSFAYGMWVEQNQSFGALLPAELSRRTGRRIEVYNEAMQWGTPHSVDLRFDEVLAAKPDMVLWTLTPFDIGSVDLTIPYVPPADGTGPGTQAGDSGGILRRLWRKASAALAGGSPVDAARHSWERVIAALDDSRSVFLLRYLLYHSESQYVKHYLMQDSAADFLNAQPSESQQRNMAQFAKYYSDVQERTRSVGAKLVVSMLPLRAQASMISMGTWPAAFDPYQIGDSVRKIVEGEGGRYVDLLHAIQKQPEAGQYYFPVDAHINVRGHALMSQILGDALLNDVSAANSTAPSGAQD